MRYTESQAHLLGVLLGCLALTAVSTANDLGSAWMVLLAIVLVPLIVWIGHGPRIADYLRTWPHPLRLLAALVAVAIGCGVLGIRLEQFLGAVGTTVLSYLALISVSRRQHAVSLRTAHRIHLPSSDSDGQ